MGKQEPKRKTGKIIGIVIAAVFCIALLAVGMCLIVQRPALRTVEEYSKLFPDAEITRMKDGSVEIGPADKSETRKTGVIFYIGAQIRPDAYIPLLARLSEQGYFCAIPKIPFNMASIKPDAADEIMKKHPEIEKWVLAGHSMGGYTASGYAEDHMDKTAGLILLAAYTSRDLSETSLPVLSVYGSNDGVLNRRLYTQRLLWNSSDFEEHILSGGNHAQFGDYGKQPRDSDAAISMEEQQEDTAKILGDWLSTID